MLLSSRPLLDTLADAAYFVDREAELDAIGRAVEQSLNVLVLGGRGAGKTSLLRQAAHKLREKREHRVEVVDAAIAGGDTAALLAFVAERLLGPEEVTVPVEGSGSFRQTVARIGGRTEERPTPAGKLLAVVDRLRGGLWREMASVGGDEEGPWYDPTAPIVVVLDGAPAGVSHTLFGQLRDELWSLPIVWVVSGDEADRAGFLRPPADAFFDVRLELAPLGHAAAQELVRRRFDRPPPKTVLQRIVGSTDRMPRALVTAARRHVSDPSSSDEQAQQRRAAAQAKLFAIGRPAAMLVSEMQARGGAASASDEDLLRVLGWSRPRAAQVLKQLEEAGLVTASRRRTEGAGGRPRTVYELIEDVL
jgi:hypothetical protein